MEKSPGLSNRQLKAYVHKKFFFGSGNATVDHCSSCWAVVSHASALYSRSLGGAFLEIWTLCLDICVIRISRSSLRCHVCPVRVLDSWTPMYVITYHFKLFLLKVCCAARIVDTRFFCTMRHRDSQTSLSTQRRSMFSTRAKRMFWRRL